MRVSAEFVASAASARDFPSDRLAQVALVGRSNVGKSSLINALVRRAIARTSAAPGKTRLANFYRVVPAGRRAFYLVDLPGYGYARGGGPAAEDFRRLAEEYFDREQALEQARERALGALLIVDSRHPGLEADMAAWEWMRTQPFPSAVAASKVDKLTRAERARHSRQLDTLFAGPVPFVSAHSGEGLEELWKTIVALASPPGTGR